MGVYGLAWTPAFIFEVIWTPEPNFWSKGPLVPNSKISNFLTKPQNKREIPILGKTTWEGLRTKFLVQGPFGPKFKNL